MGIWKGLAAGAAGTTALNTVTYLDMVYRGRGSSSAPQDAAEKLADAIGVNVPGDEETRSNRLSGLGALLGIATGVGVGKLLGLSRSAGLRPSFGVTALVASAAAMLGSDVPMIAMGISDPREWSASDWLSDAVPHLAYGLVTAAVLHGDDD